jgi:DNA-binding transcriptional LysR family regulator
MWGMRFVATVPGSGGFVELRHLRYFVAVAEELHFRHAAERLHVAQPAVSEQVRKLEAELGVTLFERTQRSVKLTVAGTAMLEEARRVLRQADIAVRAARDARQREVGRMRIGYMPDALPPAVPRALPHFSAAAPGIGVVLDAGRPLQLVEDVRHGLLDVAVVTLPVPAKGLRVTPLGLDRAIAALPDTHPLSDDDAVRPERLADRPLVLVPRMANPSFYDGVIACWRAAGSSHSPVEAAEPYVEYSLLAVAAGAGIAVVPESAAARHSVAGVRFVALDPAPTTEVAAITRDEASTTVTALLKLLRRAAQQPRRVALRAVASA